MVSTRTSVGSIGILANHQPLLAMLDPTELRLYKSDSEVIRYAQGEGFLQMTGDRALVLVDEVFEVDKLNAVRPARPPAARRGRAVLARRRAARSAAPPSATSAATRPSSSSPRAAPSARTSSAQRRRAALGGPSSLRRALVDYGFVVESVKVSVFE